MSQVAAIRSLVNLHCLWFINCCMDTCRLCNLKTLCMFRSIVQFGGACLNSWCEIFSVPTDICSVSMACRSSHKLCASNELYAKVGTYFTALLFIVDTFAHL